MAKGDIFPSEATRMRDRLTGRTLWRLTGRQAVNHGPWSCSPPATRDGARIIFGSDRAGGGGEQLFAVEWPSGAVVQLTAGRAICAYNAVLAPRGAEVYCFDGAELRAVSIATFRERTLAVLPEGASLSGAPTVSADGQLVVYAAFRPPPGAAGLSGAAWSEAVFQARPTTELWVAPTDGSGARVVHAEDRWLSCPRLLPGDGGTVAYGHEGPAQLVQRLWAVPVSGGGAPRALRPQEPGREAIGDERPSQDGRSLLYVHAGIGDGAAAAEPSIRQLDLAGGTERTLFRGPLAGGFAANADCSLLAAEMGQGTEHGLYLIDVSEGAARPLCECRRRGSPHGGEPLPCFSHDGRHVFFNSDGDGWPNLYMAVV